MYCPNPNCPNHGRMDGDNIGVHSRKEGRYRCRTCGRTFSQTTGTPFYRLHTNRTVVRIVVNLLAYGCPLQAIVHAFDLDERTVRAWLLRVGRHLQRVHEEVVEAGKLDARHVQADELLVKLVQRKVWMATAIAVPCRLWLGGIVAGGRDGELIRALAERVRRCLSSPGILLCTDGCSSYVTQFCRCFRVPEPRTPGNRARPKKVLPESFLLGQVIKRYLKHRVAGVSQRAVIGTMDQILERVQATGGRMIHTAYVERLNATFRCRLAALVRRTRSLVRREQTLAAGMYLVGGVYNFCTPHRTLREALLKPEAARGRRKWRERTPAMAAGLTDHVWSVSELLWHRVPTRSVDVARWRRRKRRGAIIPAIRAPARGREPTTV
jgi:transposase-like protein